MLCPQPPALNSIHKDSHHIHSVLLLVNKIECRVWAVSLSLAATQEIEFSFFSSGYLDVSVPLVFLHTPMDSVYDA